MPTYGYARVSTDGQTLDAQIARVQVKVARRHTPAGHVRRPYMIFAAMSAVVALVAAAVISD